MSASVIQKELGLFQLSPLSGDFLPAKEAVLSWNNWYDGSYQADIDAYLSDHNGFNPLLIRLHNQIDFSLYHELHAEGVVAGKDGQYFEYDYIRSLVGEDYLGEEIIGKKIRKLAFLQRFMKDSLDIDLLFILEPGKATCYQENIADKYLRLQKEENNYREILNQSKKYGVTLVDYNSWYAGLRDTASHPLYSQYGTHWSSTGMWYVADSLLKLIASRNDLNLRKVEVDTIVTAEPSRNPDYDMGDAMNLLIKLKDEVAMAYPEYTFEPASDQHDRPNVLVVGDSYYWHIYNSLIPREVFNNEPYWYFGRAVYPDFYYNPTYVSEINFKEEIEKQDVILLMTTERFLYKFDWHLINALYDLYGMNSRYDKLDKYISEICDNDEWFNRMIIESKHKKQSIEESLIENGRYSYWDQDPLAYAVYYGVEEQAVKIRQDESWLKKTKIKAQEAQISLDEMIQQDAAYLLSQSNQEAYDIWTRLENNKSIILQDSLLTRQINEQASYYQLTFEEMLQIQAEQLAEEFDK